MIMDESIAKLSGKERIDALLKKHNTNSFSEAMMKEQQEHLDKMLEVRKQGKVSCAMCDYCCGSVCDKCHEIKDRYAPTDCPDWEED